LPSGLKWTVLTSSVWPSSVVMHCPDATSHTRTVLSLDPYATCLPSGLKETDITTLVWPSSVVMHCPDATSHTRTVLS